MIEHATSDEKYEWLICKILYGVHNDVWECIL